jgi:hypothetical protein
MAATMMSISLEVALLTLSWTAPTVTTGLDGKLLPKMLRSPPVCGKSLGSTESIVNEAVVVVVAPEGVVVVVPPAEVVVVPPGEVVGVLPDVVVVLVATVVDVPCPTEG